MHDLHVQHISDALSAKNLDVVVSGSIGAVESIKFIRSLRRLGAHVRPWLTDGGKQFVTPMALSWAAATATVENFTGEATHIATGDAVIVAPASANILSQIAQGQTSSPALALIASYLGQKKPVILMPAAHDSLMQNPLLQRQLEILRPYVHFASSRHEEGKNKFPDPETLADQVAYVVNKNDATSALVTMGTTRGYIDDVRYISNYSSGQLGTNIVTELYRHGIDVAVVSGPAAIQPRVYTKIIAVETNAEMEQAVQSLTQEGYDAAIACASVLDFVPATRLQGKVRSHEELKVTFKPTAKIIEQMRPRQGIKVGFKLEPELNQTKAQSIAEDYFKRYQLTGMLLNAKNVVSASRHQGFWVTRPNNQWHMQTLESKTAIAQAITAHVCTAIKKNALPK